MVPFSVKRSSNKVASDSSCGVGGIHVNTSSKLGSHPSSLVDGQSEAVNVLECTQVLMRQVFAHCTVLCCAGVVGCSTSSSVFTIPQFHCCFIALFVFNIHATVSVDVSLTRLFRGTPFASLIVLEIVAVLSQLQHQVVLVTVASVSSSQFLSCFYMFCVDSLLRSDNIVVSLCYITGTNAGCSVYREVSVSRICAVTLVLLPYVMDRLEN